MNLLADESVDRQIVERLRRDGNEVVYVAEMEPGSADEVVLARANERGALLMTADKDFGELIFREGRLSSGDVILLRFTGFSSTLKAEITSSAFRDHVADFPHHFSVISPGGIRTRREI